MTQWTQEQYEELSRNVAEKFNQYPFFDIGDISPNILWLYEDWERIMELCVEHWVWASHMPEPLLCVDYFAGSNREGEVYYADHSNDKSLAERVARMLALLEVEA